MSNLFEFKNKEESCMKKESQKMVLLFLEKTFKLFVKNSAIDFVLHVVLFALQNMIDYPQTVVV